jgi:hypothetical protein
MIDHADSPEAKLMFAQGTLSSRDTVTNGG